PARQPLLRAACGDLAEDEELDRHDALGLPAAHGSAENRDGPEGEGAVVGLEALDGELDQSHDAPPALPAAASALFGAAFSSSAIARLSPSGPAFLGSRTPPAHSARTFSASSFGRSARCAASQKSLGRGPSCSAGGGSGSGAGATFASTSIV